MAFSESLVGRTLLGRYHVQALIGRGGMAEVYKVWDSQRAAYLAMKVLREDLAEDRVFLRRFRREAATLARLQHPNIVHFYGLEREGTTVFMLMDYVEGKTLRRAIFEAEGKPLPRAEVLRVTEGMCSALHYAHSQGLVHSDIKPGNVMISTGGQVLLMDFGIARMMDAATMTMVGAGTPAYMAPELVRGEMPTPASDIYALGVVLYEMVTGGERPFTGEQASITGTVSERVRWEQLNVPPTDPRVYNSVLPENVSAVILKCLAKDPAARYQNALEVWNALAAAWEGEAEQAPLLEGEAPDVGEAELAAEAQRRVEKAEEKGTEMRKPRRRLRGLWVWGGGAALVVLVLGVAVLGRGDLVLHSEAAFPSITPTFTFTPTATFTPTPTFTPTATLTPTPFVGPVLMGTPYPLSGDPIAEANVKRIVPLAWWKSVGKKVYSIAFSPDGTLLAGGTRDATVRLWQTANGTLVHTLKGHTGGVFSVAFSPDGRLLASGADDHTIRLWQVSDGKLMRIIRGHTRSVSSVAFSPDGTLLSSASGDHTVRIWRVSDGQLLHILRGHSAGVRSVAFSPDSRLLASGGWDNVVRVWRVFDGRLLRTLEGHSGVVLGVAFSPDGALLASASDDHTVRVWRVSDGQLLWILKGHSAGVASVAFSPDGALLASASGDHTVRLWRVSDGRLLRTLEGPSVTIFSVAFSPDGRLLASGLADGTIRLWGVP